jgi:hypothetical protein
MSRLFLVQVGKSAWVDPDAIQAIEWSNFYDCPMLLLSGQQRSVNATNFKNLASAAVTNNAEACTNALLAWLLKADLKRNQL